MGEPGGDRKQKLQHWRTAQPTDGLPSPSPKGQPLKGRPQPPEDGTWGAPVPVQGINNRQGKEFGDHAKRQPSWSGSGRRGSRLLLLLPAAVVHPVTKHEAVPGRPSWSEPPVCQRNASQGQVRCQGQFTHGEYRELRRDSVGCLESGGSLCNQCNKTRGTGRGPSPVPEECPMPPACKTHTV